MREARPVYIRCIFGHKSTIKDFVRSVLSVEFDISLLHSINSACGVTVERKWLFFPSFSHSAKEHVPSARMLTLVLAR